jgi:hypothetical protein
MHPPIQWHKLFQLGQIKWEFVDNRLDATCLSFSAELVLTSMAHYSTAQAAGQAWLSQVSLETWSMATSCGAKHPLQMFLEIEAKLYPLL